MTTESTPDSAAPDTIVLIHGLWVTPRSWEKWVEHYEGKGYRVLTPAYPGLEVEVEALNEDPSPIEALTIPAVVEHLENIVGELETPPTAQQLGTSRSWLGRRPRRTAERGSVVSTDEIERKERHMPD